MAGVPALEADTLPFSPSALDFCRRLPKVELHAHLNGSIPDEVLRQLVARKALEHISVQHLDDITSKRHRGLDDCFRLFDIIHQCVNDHDSVTHITEEVIVDFAQDGCVYLELRTTPKHRPRDGMTKASYTQAVLQGIQSAGERVNSMGRSCTVRLLLSVDRREDAEAALETVRLAASLRDQGVVGIDLSGNPRVGVWSQWLPALSEARAHGLGITLHGGEVDAIEEVSAMLDFRPERFGHMCCLSEAAENRLMELGVPVELCITSNIKTITFPSAEAHHFAKLYESKHPVVLCTDDSGVFGTSLSQEYAIAMTTFKLSERQMADLALSAVDHTFLTQAERTQLREDMQRALADLVQ